MPYKTSKKQRAYQKEHYQKNKVHYREDLNKRRAIRAKWFFELKSSLVCEKCGEKHPACLEFHHNNPKNKIMSVANMVRQAFSEAKIVQEIEKCNCWCSNCHQKFHWEQRAKNKVVSQDYCSVA